MLTVCCFDVVADDRMRHVYLLTVQSLYLGGKGVNYASFYPGSNECVLSDKVPTCFEPMAGAVAYTALSGLDLEPVPCLPSFAPQVSVCNFHTCKRSVTSCHDGSLQTLAEDCSLEDTKKCVQEEKPEPNEEKKEEGMDGHTCAPAQFSDG